MKTCSKCGVPKDEAEFSKRAVSKDGLSPKCKICASEYDRGYRIRPEVVEHERKPEVLAARRTRERNRKQRPEVKRVNKERRRKHRLKPEVQVAQREYQLGWISLNPGYHREYANTRYREDEYFRLAVNLRNRANAAFRTTGTKKSAASFELFGCPLVWVKVHLESLFRPGMTWDNHGPVWHIDHKKPCAAFDLTDPEQQRACFHWTNLQPLFALENLQKSDKYAPPEHKAGLAFG